MSELHRMQREQEDAEVIVSLDYLKDQATICVSDWPSQARRFEKLFGAPTTLTRQTSRFDQDGHAHTINRVRSAIWKVPLGSIKLGKKHKKISGGTGGFKKRTAEQEVLPSEVLKQKQAS